MLLLKLVNKHRIFEQNAFRYHRSLRRFCHAVTVESVLGSELGLQPLAVSKLMAKHAFLHRINPLQMRTSIKALKQLKYRSVDIQTHPKLLMQNDDILVNHYHRLLEIGFPNITAHRLVIYKDIMESSVYFNERINFLPKNIDILRNIFNVANVSIIELDETLTYEPTNSLASIYDIAMKYYLKKRWNIRPESINQLEKNYGSLQSRAISNIEETAQLLEQTFKTQAHLLSQHFISDRPHVIRQLLQLRTVCGIDIRSILRQRGTRNYERVKRVAAIAQTHNIPNYAMAFSKSLFVMQPEVIEEHLTSILKFPRSREFLQHIAIGKLISRMSQIQRKIDSMGLDYEKIFNERFIALFLQQFSINKSYAGYFYLCHIFKKTEAELRNAVSGHPQATNIAFDVVHRNINYLLSKNFSLNDIFNDIHIILYSKYEIIDCLEIINNSAEMAKLSAGRSKLTNSQKLKLCVYLIERKCDFNGEGIFINSDITEYSDEEYVQMDAILENTK